LIDYGTGFIVSGLASQIHVIYCELPFILNIMLPVMF